MATWNNQNENTSAWTNEAFGSASLTWDEATFTWAQAQGTWDNPYAWINQTKDSSSFTNQTKH